MEFNREYFKRRKIRACAKKHIEELNTEQVFVSEELNSCTVRV